MMGQRRLFSLGRPDAPCKNAGSERSLIVSRDFEAPTIPAKNCSPLLDYGCDVLNRFIKDR
jgi:hypothetical protein